MPFTQEDILAGTFFDLADKVQQISESEIAQSVETFSEEDYASLIASILDAGYWIQAGQLGDEIDDDESGLYVKMEVYTDLLYRGFEPNVCWEESGLETHFELVEPDTSGPKADGKKKGSIAREHFNRGDYVQFDIAPGQMRAGMLMTYPEVLCFDGVVSSIEHLPVKKLTREAALDVLGEWGSDITDIVRRRVDASGSERSKTPSPLD